jgi:hypothetical protein
MRKARHREERQLRDGARAIAALVLTMLLGISASPGHSAALVACPNEALRGGPSAQLADCRAYELVTPRESNGRRFGDLVSEVRSFDVFANELASPLLESFLFETKSSSLREPPGGNGRNNGDVYETVRTASGWRVARHVSPTGAETVAPTTGAVSPDHKYNFVFVPHFGDEGSNGSLGQEGEADYLGDPNGSFELTGIGSLGSERLVQGRYISPGGEHVIFSTGHAVQESGWCSRAGVSQCPVKRLEPEAPPNGTGAVYDRAADGPTHVVSLLPGDVTPAAGEDATYQGASADGSTVAFEIEGTLYVRIDNAKTEEVAGGDPAFGGLSEDGSHLFYESGGNIHRFNTASEADQQVNASGDAKMVNASADGSRAYFISPTQLDGAEGTAGQPNLYVWSGGPPEYIATVAASDTTGNTSLTYWARYAVAPNDDEGRGPGADPSRTTPDGRVIVFESRAQLTPYNNAGHTEIYRYDDTVKSLSCVSCNPAATPAATDARLEDLGALERTTIVRNVSADGARVFFETSEALVEGDVDSVNDVYEWQQPAGEGGPTLSLISPGNSVAYPQLIPGVSPRPNVLMGVSPDGDDVFFLSQEPLVAGAGVGGASAIYDARIDGGFAEPPTPAVCLEEACRPPPSLPPVFGSAPSSELHGSGNVVAKKHRRCRRRQGKRRHCSKRRSRSSARGAAASSVSDRAGAGDAPPESVPEPLAAALGPAAAGPLLSVSEFEDFGVESVAAGVSTTEAARHPDLTTSIALTPPKTLVGPRVEDLAFELPPGVYGNPNLVPRCRTGDFVGGECPVDSQVGISRVKVHELSGFSTVPVFNLAPVHPAEEIARFGLMPVFPPVFIDVSVRTAGDYGVTAAVHSAPSEEALEAAETIIWGNPADPSHDELRMTINEGSKCSSPCEAPGGKRPSGLPPIAFMTNPSACQQGEIGATVTSYQLPGQIFSKSAPMNPITNCQGLPFAPSFEAKPTSRVAGAPTGLKTMLKLPQTSDPEVPSTATMREARVTLPAGMTISPGAADGLAACSDQQVGFHKEVDAACPDAAKLGTAEIASPALPHPLAGALYQRSPTSGHQFGLWLVSDDLGLHIKIPGEIEPDPNTGQVTAVFSDLPKVPVEEIELEVWGGARAPLKNPDFCGTYATSYTFAPHSNDPPVTGQSQMTIDEGCGPRGFSPILQGGATSPVAGAFSPFLLDILREDREQNLAGFEFTLPEGELAKVKGVPLCSDDAAATGACPAASRVGTLLAAAGPGPLPLWIPQPGREQPAIYLAGPYKSAPYSIVGVVPAQAGPFDLGNVVVRSALALDRETAVATVRSDPLPQLIEGVPISYRRLHVVTDRPEFTLNPTDCREQAISSTISSTEGAVAHPSARFEVDGCKGLGFKPKLALKLKGGSKRGDYPALISTLRARRGDANLARVSVALPHSEFLAQEHIQTICTRKQFTANKCPRGSVYGRAKAWTPLLDKPLAGPVYLRSSDHPLPDLVIDLRGQIDVAVAGRIDSIHGGIRASFEAVPDAPISRFVLKMKGGAKGLLVNSANICSRRHRATVAMRAQNGRALSGRPVLRVGCG